MVPPSCTTRIASTRVAREHSSDVMRGWNVLNQHGVDVNILCSVHAANAEHPLEVYRFFRDELKTSFIQFIPIIERVTEEMLPVANMGWGERGSDPRPLISARRESGDGALGRRGTMGAIPQRDLRRVGSAATSAACSSRCSMPRSHPGWACRPSMCVFSETCGTALALEHNGDVYSCDHFVEPKYLLGNIQKVHMLKLVTSEQQRQFGLAKRDTLPRYCRECSVRFACHGECPKNRFIATPDGEPGLNYLCAGYKAFFTHIDRPMRMMADLLRQGRFADEAMEMLTNS